MAASDKYPECAKLAVLGEKRNNILEFLDYLREVENLRICVYDGTVGREGAYFPWAENLDNLVLRFLGIDAHKLEQERRELLEDLVKSRAELLKRAEAADE